MNEKDNLTDAVEIASDTDTSSSSNDNSNWQVSDSSGEQVTLGEDDYKTK